MVILRKIATLGTMYFVQGLPYGFQDKFIPTYLRSAGHSYTQLSLMKLLLLPWLCKTLFAPVIDIFWTKSLWLLYSLSTLAATAFLGLFISPSNFIIVSTWIFTLNMASAVQDVAVDGLALSILQDKEIGHGNTAQVVGYKLGALFGGGILFWIHFRFGWSGLCLLLFVLYISAIFLFVLLYEDDRKNLNANAISHDYSEEICHPKSYDTDVKKRKTDKASELLPLDAGQQSEKLRDMQTNENVFQVFLSVFKVKGTLRISAFILLYKMGERGALSSFPLFLVDRGVTVQQLGFWSGVVSQIASLSGSVLGGWLLRDKRRLLIIVRHVCLLRNIPVFVEWFIVNLWKHDSSNLTQNLVFCLSILSICCLDFLAGIMTTAVFTLMMSCSLSAPPSVQGTHYTFLSSTEVAGKLIFSAITGALIDWLGVSLVYFIFVILTLSVYFLVPNGM